MKLYLVILALFNLTFTVNAQTKRTNDRCSGATSLISGQSINDVVNFISISEVPSCETTKTKTSRGLWYKFEGKNKIVAINIENRYSYTTKMTLFEGDCGNLICSKEDVNKFLSKANTSYFLFVESSIWYSLNEAPFKLTFDEFDFTSMSSCVSAPFLNCNQDYVIDKKLLLPIRQPGCFTFGPAGYFRIKGDGQTRELNFSTEDIFSHYIMIFEYDNCNQLKCTKTKNIEPKMVFSTSPGKSYLIAISQHQGSSSEINLRVNCSPDTISRNCLSALKLECGKQYTASPNQNALPELQNLFHTSSWYKITGNGKQMKLLFDNQPPCAFRVYKSSSGCNELINYLYKDFSIRYSSLVVDTETNTDYFIEMIHTSGIEIRFSTTCENVSQNNFTCTSAKNVGCDDKIHLYSFTNEEPNLKEKLDIGQWFRFKGNDSVYAITTLNPNIENYTMTVFKDSCASLKPIISITSNDGFNQGINYLKFNRGENYLIRFNLDKYHLNSFDVQVNCWHASVFNSVCTNVDSLYCNKDMSFGKTPIFDFNGSQCNYFKGIWYKLTGTGDTYTLPLKGIFGHCDIYEGNCNTLKCIKSVNFGMEDFNFTTKAGTEYMLKVIAYHSFTSFPNKKIRCNNDSVNGACPEAKPIDCDTQVLNLNFTTGSYFNNDSFKCVKSGYGFWYKLEGNNKMYNFIKGAHTTNFKMQTIKTSNCSKLFCGNTEVFDHLKIYAEKGFTYFIFFSAQELTNNNIVQVSCSEIQQNTNCASAIDLKCNSEFFIDFGAVEVDTLIREIALTDLWYKHTGNDSLVTISKIDTNDLYLGYQIFVDGCDSLIATNMQDPVIIQFYRAPFSFYAKKGQNYYIRLISNQNKKNRLQATCSDFLPGDLCTKAKAVTCGETHKINTRDYTIDYVGAGLTVYKGAWFVFEGNGSYFEVTNPASYTVYIFSALNGCDDLTMTNPKSHNGFTFGFFAEKNKKYYFLAGNSHWESPDTTFSLSFQCSDASINRPTCHEARTIKCGDNFVSHNLKENLTTFGSCSPPNAGDWFKFTGDGNVWTFFFEGQKYNLSSFHAYIGSGSCDTLECVKAFDIRNDWLTSDLRHAFNVKTKPNVTYFLKIASYENFPIYLNVSVICTPVSTNESCNTDLKVNCNDEWKGYFQSTTINATPNVCNENSSGHYYQVTGTGTHFLMTLDKYTGTKELKLSIIENDCINGRCLYQGSLSFQNSKTILFETKSNRKYIIKISSDQDDVVYRIKTKCEPKPDNISCESAEFLNCNSTFNANIQTPIGFNGDVPCYDTRSSSLWYILPKTDSLFEVEILEKTDPTYLVEIVKGKCNSIKCDQSLNNNDLRLAFSTQNDEDNYLVIHGDNSTVNNLKLKLNCVKRPANDLCEKAISISCGDTIYGGTYLSTTTQFKSDCNEYSQNDVWFRFKGNGEKNRFKFSNLSAGLIVNIYEAKKCDTTFVCKYNSEIWTSEIRQIVDFVGEEGKEYFLQVSNYNIKSTLFTILYSCLKAVPNDLCSGAIPLSAINRIDLTNSTGEKFRNFGKCSETTSLGIWYSIDGNDSIAHIKEEALNNENLRYLVFDGSCNSLKCIANGQFNSHYGLKFKTFKNKKYFILIYHPYNIVTNPSIVHLRYFGSGLNDDCRDATEIKCGDNLRLNSDYYSKDTSSTKCLEDRSSAWYKVKSDSTMVFKMSSDFPEIDFDVEVFINCDTTCALSKNFNRNAQNSLQFIIQQGFSYFIRVSCDEREVNKTINISTSCGNLEYQNLTKEQALPLECKDYVIDAKQLYRQMYVSCFPYFSRQLYYKFTGNGTKFRYIRSPDFAISFFYTKSEDCKDFSGSFINQEFQTIPGQDYFLVVAITQSEPSGLFKFRPEYKCSSNILEFEDNDIDIKIVPNPFDINPKIQIKSDFSGPAEIKITDYTGRVILSKEHFINSHNRDDIILEEINQLPAGMYMFQLITSKGVAGQRMIKIR